MPRCEAKDRQCEQQIGFDISSSSAEWRGYTLRRTMSQPLMGQRRDALISLIDGLEAYNSHLRTDDQENSGERERSLSKQSEEELEHDLNGALMKKFPGCFILMRPREQMEKKRGNKERGKVQNEERCEVKSESSKSASKEAFLAERHVDGWAKR